MSKPARPGVDPTTPKDLPAEAVEGAKSAILHGTGYKRPPQHSQFKKGQSGNPKGRPKSDKTSGFGWPFALTLKEAERMITVREGDRVNQISTIEAVHRAQSAAALKGSAYAQKHIIESYQRAERARQSEIQKSNEFWASYVRAERAALAHAARNGLPLPTSLPHPDDVVIDPALGVRFIGPFDETTAEMLRTTILLRDVLLMQDALQQREDEAQPGHQGSTALVCAMRLDQSVPQRFRLSEQDWVLRMMRLQGTPIRELRRRLSNDWAVLGVEWGHDNRLPALSQFRAMLEQLLETAFEPEQADAG